MQFLPTLVLIFSSISISFGFSKAMECQLNNKDSSKVAYTITVDQSSGGNFRKIQDAINSIPSDNDRWIRIHARQGIYLEKVAIPRDKPCIILEGDGRDLTTITWGDHEETDTSATFSSFSDNFVAKGITFENSYNHPLKPNSEITQALAARIYGDKSAFYECGFLGLQDTLWDVQGRHFFKSCYIEGAVDFIFGDGQSFFQECSINVTAGLLPPQNFAGFFTAQSRKSSDDPGGFVFNHCIVSGSGQVYLGRAYGPFSRVIFVGTTLNTHVIPEGWNAWKYPGGENDFTYVEANCRGSGSDTSKRVKWEKKLSSSELSRFTRSSFIDHEGWIAKLP